LINFQLKDVNKPGTTWLKTFVSQLVNSEIRLVGWMFQVVMTAVGFSGEAGWK
jgi:hypothetical protein